MVIKDLVGVDRVTWQRLKSKSGETLCKPLRLVCFVRFVRGSMRTTFVVMQIVRFLAGSGELRVCDV